MSRSLADGYRERWVAPWWWWLSALGLGLLVAAELHGGAAGLRSWLPYAVVPPLALALLALGSRGRIAVREGVLHVPGARIELAALDAPVVLDREALRQQTGPMADRRAFVVSRPWLHTGVRVMVCDDADPTPYWVVGSRHPDRLVSALLRRP